MKKRGLSLRQKRFLDNYFGSARGNGTRAAIMAGYAAPSARVTAARLLAKANIGAAVRARQAQESTAAIAGANERDEALTRILREAADPNVRIRAAAELNKCNGRHSLRHEVGGRLLLEQVLANSRQSE